MRLLALPLITLTALFTTPLANAIPIPGPAIVSLEIDGMISAPVEIAVGNKGDFRAELGFAVCDGSVLPGDSKTCEGGALPEASALLGIAGSVFPFISAGLSFTDSGAPSAVIMTVLLPIVPITGQALGAIEGSLTLPPDPETPGSVSPAPGDTAFLTGSAGPDPGSLNTLLTMGSGAVVPQPTAAPETIDFGNASAGFDCSGLGSCSVLQFRMSMTGLGDGQTTVLVGRFDLDPETAQVPLPSSAWLLAGGLAALLLRRRTPGGR